MLSYKHLKFEIRYLHINDDKAMLILKEYVSRKHDF